MGPNPKDWCLYRKEKFGHTHTHAHSERRVKMKTDQGDESTSQGTPSIGSDHQKLGERPGTDSPSQPPGRTNHHDTLISNFQPPEL